MKTSMRNSNLPILAAALAGPANRQDPHSRKRCPTAIRPATAAVQPPETIGGIKPPPILQQTTVMKPNPQLATGNLVRQLVCFWTIIAVMTVGVGLLRAGGLVPIVAVTGSHGGDYYATGMPALINGSGITKADPADPATWTFNGSSYADEWMASSLRVGSTITPGLNGKCAWVSFDLGATTAVKKLYLFNNNYGGGISGTNQFNLYCADSPTVALPTQPANDTYANTGLTPQGDYDFSGGGWTWFNTGGALTATTKGTTIVDLTGVSARYLAVEILSNWGETYAYNRVGFDEVAVTQVDAVAPTLAGTDIVDDKSGEPVLVNAPVTYKVTFGEDIAGSTVSAADFGNAGTAAITIGTITETSPGVFSVTVTPTSVGTLQLQVPAGASITDVAGNPLDTSAAIVDDTTIVVTDDLIPPTLAGSDIVDNQGGGPIAVSTVVVYTVTFSEDIAAGTVSADAFGNAGTTDIAFGTISETSPGVFSVQVTPTSGGTLQLQVPAGASITDVAGNPLNTSSAIVDDTVIAVDATPPTLAGSDIVDNKSGGPVVEGTLVTYTVTFSEDLAASTVSATDFGNAGTATVSIGTVGEVAPGVVAVQVTPTSAGTLQLQVPAGAFITDAVGVALNTDIAIVDDTTVTVDVNTAVASVISIAAVTGSHGGDSYANGMVSLTNGSGITMTDPANPATWTFSGSDYGAEWMANYLTGAVNAKKAWACFDLGATTALHTLYLFNSNYGGGPSGTKQYHLYYADSPTVALPARPNAGAYSDTGLTPQGDYDFSSGGWTLFNPLVPLTAPQSGTATVTLAGISARHLAVEILSNYGDTYAGGRVGFDEVAVTGVAGSGGTDYAAWQSTNGATGQTLDQDHDGDGVANGIEYFLGGNTNTTGFTALPGVTNTGGTLSITWTKAADYAGTYGTGADFVVETSSTLADGSWTPVAASGTPATPDTVSLDGNDVTYTFPSPLGAKKFARLKVTGP
ncbi:MAG: hypothetical protein NTW21_08710 [Verrucomicrobia bacterium]|nr:hypothetical protein [Verrucomicrobiota bacterium]